MIGDRVSVAADSLDLQLLPMSPCSRWAPTSATSPRTSASASRVQAGRGDSFTVQTEVIGTPAGLPARRARRVHAVPGRLRVAGTMEFRGPIDPVETTRADAIVASVRDLLPVRLDERSQSLGRVRAPSRPTPCPLVGATRQPGVYVAGGHGMWGVTLGPVTGRLLAEQITTGKQPTALFPVDPLR